MMDSEVRQQHVISSMTALQGSDLFKNKQTFFTQPKANHDPFLFELELKTVDLHLINLLILNIKLNQFS